MDKYQWIKLDIDIFNNRKIKRLEAEEDGQLLVLIWIKLLVLSAKIKDNGQVYITKNVGYSIKELANELGYFGKKLEKIVEKSLELFEKLEMISKKDGIITVENWSKYQDYEKEEKRREINRISQQKYREKSQSNTKSNADSNADISIMNPLCNGVDKEEDVDVDVDVEEEKEVDKNILTNKSLSNVLSERVNEPNAIATSYPKKGNKLIELELIHPVAKMGLEKSIEKLSDEQFERLIHKLQEFVDSKGLIKSQYPLMLAINEVMKGG